MFDAKQRFVESLAIYCDTHPIYPRWFCKTTESLLHHSLTTLGVSVMATKEGTLGSKAHPELSSFPCSMGEPFKWHCPELILGQGALTEEIHRRALEHVLSATADREQGYHAICSKVSQLLTQQTNRARLTALLTGVSQHASTVWGRPQLVMIAPGHAERPMLSPLPTIVCSLGSKGGEQGGRAQTEGTTLLLFSCADLRELDIETRAGNSFIDYNHLVGQIRRSGKVNGSVIRCRVITVNALYPVATWPGDWICCVIGDPSNGQEGQDILAMTAWKPTDAANLQRALGTLETLQADGRALQSLQELGFGEHTFASAREWLEADRSGPPIEDL
jgi:hypothetical protein